MTSLRREREEGNTRKINNESSKQEEDQLTPMLEIF
jgi:hypothetical protein